MTRAEYENTIKALFGDDVDVARSFPDEELALGFSNNADAQTTSALLIEAYEDAGATIAAQMTDNPQTLLGCDVAQEACVRGFITTFGRRAYRRPLAKEEADRLYSFFATSKTTYDAKTGLRLMVQAMLQSPHFLYRVEEGGAEAEGTVTRLSSYEIASRLSYLLWGSMPDNELLDAAAANQLDTPARVLAQAQRLLADPKAKPALARFFEQWLDLNKVGHVDKSATLFPKFTREIRGLLRQEQDRFLEDVVFGGGSLSTLLLADYTYMNKDLATYYGVTGPSGSAFVKVPLDTSKRVGFLTTAGFLASSAKVNQSSPVQRGLYVRERLLCTIPPPPPPDVNTSPPDPDAMRTTRERFAAHEEQESCAGCHRLMDPIGFGFEQFDAAGLWRDKENGKPVDVSGSLVGTDVDGDFQGALELAQKLSNSAAVRQCVVKQVFRFGYGRSEANIDRCTLGKLNTGFAESEGRFQELVLALTQTDAFMYRTAQGASR